jgi:UDP-GlcNAc:undecaprenyl-phosphate GlcNAc-1-phosphate transferase
LDYKNLLLLFSFIIAFLVSFAATPIARIFAYKVGAIDVPKDERRIHAKPIPRLGGLAIFYGFIISVLSFADLKNISIIGLIFGSLIIVVLGAVDDVKNISAKIKLFFQVIAAIIVVLTGIRIEFFTNPNIFSNDNLIALGIWSIPITIIWIVGVTNSVNLIDGVDGLAAGICSISSIIIFFISLLSGQLDIALLTAAIAGAALGFLPYNYNPAKIFMGDTGSNFLGFALAVISIQGLFKGYAVISFVVPILILGLPILDTSFAILRRVVTRKPIMKADRGHLHHRLIDMGFSQRQTVLILYTFSAILGMSAVVLTGSGIFRAFVIIFSVVIFIIIAIKLLPLTPDANGKDE